MAKQADSGLRAALDLDRAAADLVQGRAAAAENAEDAEAAQLGLFAGSSVFGTLKLADGAKLRPAGPGRPRGASRVTKDLIKLIESHGRHPIIAMAEIVATPIDVIARTLGCKPIEAAEYHRKVMSDLAPYVAQKLPTAVQIQGANAGMLVINLGGAAGENSSALGLDMKIVQANQAEATRIIEHEQNQGLSGEDDDKSHDDKSHDGDK